MANEPSAWRIQQALSAWKEKRDAIASEEMEASFSNGPWDDDTDITAVIGNLVRCAKDAEAKEAMCKDHIDMLKNNAVMFSTRATKLRTIALDLMQVIGTNSMKFHDYSVSVRAGQPNVQVIDETAIPAEYKRTKTVISVDKSHLLSDLKQGVVIEGAELSNGSPILTIRGA